MREITLEELLEAGCHFGHQVTRQNPKAREFIFEARDNIHIIDLAKTKEGLEEAGSYIKELAAKGGSLIIVGTKRQAHTIVEEEIKRYKEAMATINNNQDNPRLFFVTSHWKGGTLTNFTEVSKNYKTLKDLTERLHSEEERAKYTKKEMGLWDKDRQKLEELYGGISEMKRIPDALFIIDTHLEHLAVREAIATGIKTVGIVDTNADPFIIDYPIPANDDAIGSLKLLVSYIMSAWIEGTKQLNEKKEEVPQKTVKNQEKEINKAQRDISIEKTQKVKVKKEITKKSNKKEKEASKNDKSESTKSQKTA